MKFRQTCIIVLTAMLTAQGIYSQSLKTETTKLNRKNEGATLVKRRVLVLNFVDLGSRKSRATYLSVTIPEAMISSLQSTGSFEVITLEEAKKFARKSRVNEKDFYNETNAIKIGKTAKADVVLMGNYFIIVDESSVDTVQIQSKAIDVHTGRNRITLTKNNNITASIFTTINQISSLMSKKMVKALPPLTKREIEKRRSLSGTKSYPFVPNYSIEAIFTSGLTPDILGSEFTGFGFRFDLESTTGRHNTFFHHVELEVWLSEEKYTQFLVLTGTLNTGFSYPVSLSKSIVLSPYILAGVFTGILFETNDYFLVPMIKPGMNVKWILNKKTTLSFHVAMPYILDPADGFFVLDVGAGFGFKF